MPKNNNIDLNRPFYRTTRRRILTFQLRGGTHVCYSLPIYIYSLSYSSSPTFRVNVIYEMGKFTTAAVAADGGGDIYLLRNDLLPWRRY